MTHKKLNLPTKVCFFCQKEFSWRKKWEKCWEAVKFCSKKCVMLNNNKNISKETREKIANSKRGQKMSEEQKRKISESMKCYREKQRESSGENIC